MSMTSKQLKEYIDNIVNMIERVKGLTVYCDNEYNHRCVLYCEVHSLCLKMKAYKDELWNEFEEMIENED